MNRVVTAVIRWMVRQAAILLLILVVLVGAAWVNGELKRAAELQGDRAALATRKDALAAELDVLKRSASERVRQAEALGQTHATYLQRKRAERQALWERHPWARKNPLSDVSLTLRFLDAEIAAYEEASSRLARARQAAARDLGARIESAGRDIERIAGEIAGVDEKLGKSIVARAAAVVRNEFPTALAILLALILAPIGVKLFLYYVIAPLAQRRPPLHLLPSSEHAGAAVPEGPASAVSVPVVLEDGEALLVRPRYLQSSPLQARKSTKWLLDWTIPLSSVLSGMFMLTKVEPSGAEPVVLSATKDPLDEVGILRLADGAAFACQPRALAGVIQHRDRPIRITRHWRFGLQAWLTLQLRFLVFHGPGRLVMKGCRGIRVEQAGSGRMINQAATLGFSANLGYATTRCETFVSYWTGEEDLFNDAFTGGPGVYVYEEMPDAKRAGGAGRYLKGCTDALLKVFGV